MMSQCWEFKGQNGCEDDISIAKERNSEGRRASNFNNCVCLSIPVSHKGRTEKWREDAQRKQRGTERAHSPSIGSSFSMKSAGAPHFCPAWTSFTKGKLCDSDSGAGLVTSWRRQQWRFGAGLGTGKVLEVAQVISAW